MSVLVVLARDHVAIVGCESLIRGKRQVSETQFKLGLVPGSPGWIVPGAPKPGWIPRLGVPGLPGWIVSGGAAGLVAPVPRARFQRLA